MAVIGVALVVATAALSAAGSFESPSALLHALIIKAAEMIISEELTVPHIEHNGSITYDPFFWITNLDNAEFEVIEENINKI